MANLPRFRKRVFGLLRAPDGSAFQKCDLCGVSVAVALYDMHDCKLKQKHKRFKGRCINQISNVKEIFDVKLERNPQRSKSEVLNQSVDKDKKSFSNQPRSPFCFFMESFKDNLKNDDQFDVDQLGFDAWRTMSTKERQKYVVQAEVVNLAYEKALLEDDNYGKVDDEADSKKVGKFDVVYNYEHSYDSESSGSLFFNY